MIIYKTIKDSASSEFEINKSRFITTIQRTADEKSAAEFIEKMRKKYYDARHNCSAFIIGAQSERKKFNDDGEPSGTAGHPILEVLEKNNLSDIAAVVTRYFGGIKLGAGGLIRAYGRGVSMALAKAQIVKKTPFQKTELQFDYRLMGVMENYLHKNNIEILKKEYTDRVKLIVLIKTDVSQQILTAITDITAAHCLITQNEEIYHDVPI